jgi:hypothetical protein
MRMVGETEKEMFFTIKMKGQQGIKYTLIKMKEGKVKSY